LCAFPVRSFCAEDPAPAPTESAADQDAPAAQPPQTPASDPTAADHAAGHAKDNAVDDHRMFGVLPNYKTVNDPDQAFTPLSAKEKFALVKHYFDPFTYVFTGITSGIEQATNDKAGYGQGMEGYGKRYGADFADGFTNELFVTGFFPTVMHEDPRYYRLGHGGAGKRVFYALSRILITHSDSGHARFNSSEFLGNIASGGISMLYYPSADRSVSGVFTRMSVEIGYDSLFNILKEFYPDLKRKFGRH
jgi:hypothetical protein